MELAKEEAVKIALDFDNHVRRGMTIAAQIDFLVDNYGTLSGDYKIQKPGTVDDDMQNGWNGGRSRFRPLGILFTISNLVWEVYRPENLVGLSPRHLTTLSNIGSGSWPSGLYYLFTKRFQTIVAASHILSPIVRAFFCAVRLSGWDWRGNRHFFGAEFERLALLSEMSGEPRPEFPRCLTQRSFFGKTSLSFGLQLPLALQAAISTDNPARFGITMTMCNKQLSKNLLLHLFRMEAINIILANFDVVKRHIPLDELALFCASSLNLPMALPLLAEIEKSAPGTLRDARDIFGNNALWYLLYSSEKGYSYSSDDEDATDIPKIEALLLEHGCDPDLPNCLELAYNTVKAARKELATIA